MKDQLKILALSGVAGVLAGSAVLGMGSTAFAADKVVWNINIFGPPRAITKGVEAMASELNKAGGPGFEIKLHYGAALGPQKQTPESIKTGGYEGGQMCAGYYPNKFPLLSVMELPFLLPSNIEARGAVERAVLAHPDIVKEMASRWNVKYFAPVILPAYEFMGNKKIEKAEDLKGVKVRISGLNAKALQVFGGVPTMVTAPEGYTALERGTIDSFGFPYSYAFGAYKMYEVSKYSTEGVAMSGFMCWIGVSTRAWDKMPAKLKAMVPGLQAKATQALFAAFIAADKKWIPIFKQRLEVSQFPASERAKLAAGAGKLWAEWAAGQEAKGRPGKKILEFVKAEVAKATK
jgi:TRAP-type C4-dicarboxylate transport system substrate-binding protein